VPDGEDADDVVLLEVVVQRDVTRFSPRDDELAQFLLHWTTDERVPGKYVDGVENAVDGIRDDGRAFLFEEFSHPLEIGEGPPRIRYFRQALALGRRAFFPAARART
jgi:hypothetical protein